eukprot:CAMPEP_0174251598 /NCGR_PEP_ID=MMETSP0439-20130205/1366_1 /TAXON_ID=0 /ORGANISM="Stereomyxa ramosa, Strain Chinc5" /LENGTH=47 /DNA_ID= /DNA_START= /DNA_END= /DNA_ORIENTATION=
MVVYPPEEHPPESITQAVDDLLKEREAQIFEEELRMLDEKEEEDVTN